jgi:transposase
MKAALYCEILERVRTSLGDSQRRVILQHDNAKPHIAKVVKKLLNDLGWETLEHPPYSPDLAPSDFHLFRSMEHALRNKLFQTVRAMEQFLIGFFASKSLDLYRRGIDSLPNKWEEVIEAEGDYFDY